MSDQSTHLSRVGFRLALALVVAIVIWLLTWSVIDELRFSSERMGVYVGEDESGVVIEDVEPELPAEQAGLQAGDVLTEINGQPIEDLEELTQWYEDHFDPGESIEVNVLRDQEQVRIDLKPGVDPDIAGLLAQIILVIAYLGLAILAAGYRRRDVRARILMLFVALVAIELAMPVGYTFGMLAIYAAILFWLATTGIQIAMELHLVSLIPNRLPIIQKRPVLVRLYYLVGTLVGLGLAGFAIYEWSVSDAIFSEAMVSAQNWVMIGWVLIVPMILIRQIRGTQVPRERNQALLVLVGILPWVLYILVSNFWPGWAELDLGWASQIENLVLLFFPAAVFIAIFRYGLFDVEHLVRRGLVYGVVAAMILVLLYTLLTAALPLIADQVGDNAGLWLITAVALVVGILFRPLRHGVERVVERGLFPERSALRHRLINIAASLSDQGKMAELVKQLADETRDALGLEWAAVVAIEGPDRELHTSFSDGLEMRGQKELVRLLNTDSATFSSLSRSQRPLTLRRLGRRHPEAARRLSRVGAEVLVPLYFQRRMIGILCLSSKKSGELFLREELELLDLFSHQIAVSFENLRLFQDATFDELTGLLRREAVLRQLQSECERAARNATPLTVFMMDLDHFKAVNDDHGHLFGDQILEAVAKAMQNRIRAVDALGRYGGEEFFLVLPDTDLEGARLVAEELRETVSELSFTAPDGSTEVRVTISIGIATASPRQHDSLALEKDLLTQADAAVYQAKHSGRNRIVEHSPVERENR